MSDKRHFFIPSFDRLEDRWVPAGNVIAKVSGGLLSIIGDDQANSISLTKNNAGGITISSGSDATTINGLSGPLTRSGIESINIKLKDGNDSLSLSQINLSGYFGTELGEGNDTLTIDRLQAGKVSGIYGQAGNDSISITQSVFNKALKLSGGAGDDTVSTFNSYFGRETEINGGAGTDIRNYYKVNYGNNSFIFSFQTTTNGSAPLANNDSATVNQGGNVIINVAGNDKIFSGTLNLASIVITQAPTRGTTVINNDGTITYTHNGSATTSDSFTYTIKNSAGTVSNPATVNLAINPVNQAPKAVNDTLSVVRTATTNIAVAANDTDVELQLDFTTITFTQLPTHGTISLNLNGTVKYINDGSAATSDSFKYTIKDLSGNLSNEATVTLTVADNVVPAATADTATVAEGGSVIMNLAGNDTDSDGSLDLTSIVITQQPTQGTLTVGTNGTVTYLHNGSETTSDTFKYTIKDNVGGVSNIATATVTITAVNDSPIANDDAATVAEGGNVIINLSANDTDADNTIAVTTITITQQPLHGSVVINNDGTVTYTHNGSELTTDTFKYNIKDSAGLVSNAAPVNITITPVNDPPVAGNDTLTMSQGGIKKINLLSNDTDADGSIDLTSIDITIAPTHGALIKNSDGTVTYTHNGSNTSTDSFSYTIKDNNGIPSIAAIVNITLVANNAAPVANNDVASLAAGASTIINLADDDTDADGTIDPGTIVITQGPANGTLTLHTDGTVTYTHNGSATVSDSFSYTLRDNLGLTSNIATVSITII